MLSVIFFLFGTIFGSFLNVCIVRIPENLSIVFPGSRCPRCQSPIKWYDNVPVLAWLWLRGKCRNCGLAISPMYPLVEFLTGALFVLCYWEFGLTQGTVKWLFFTCLIIVLTITDLRVRMLPDLVNWPGFAVGLFFSAVVPPNDGTAAMVTALFAKEPLSPHVLGLINGVLGAALASLGFWAFGVIMSRMLGRQAFGLGDVKMLAMIGAFVGPLGVFLTVLVGSFVGSMVGTCVIVGLYFAGWKRQVAERARKRGLGTLNRLRWKLAKRYQLPFGTYLGVGALTVVFFGPGFLQLWMTLIGRA